MAAKYDAGDEAQVATKKSKAELETEDAHNRLAFMMHSPKGRSFMYQLLETAGVFRTTFDKDSDRVTSFREGQRNVGLIYMAQIQSSFMDQFVVMLKEHKLREGK